MNLPSADRKISRFGSSRVLSQDTTAPTPACKMIPCSQTCEARLSLASCSPPPNCAGTTSWHRGRKQRIDLPAVDGSSRLLCNQARPD